MKLELSSLPKTWLIDLDGTIMQHNGYKNMEDVLLDGVKEFFAKISTDDYIIFLTARKSIYKDRTIEFLEKNKLRYNHIIFDLPVGERILLNDDKPSGLTMGHAINKLRDGKLEFEFQINEDL